MQRRPARRPTLLRGNQDQKTVSWRQHSNEGVRAGQRTVVPVTHPYCNRIARAEGPKACMRKPPVQRGCEEDAIRRRGRTRRHCRRELGG
jgi:hypothetical protein